MTGIWREPLVHFAVLGAALFAAHGLWSAKVSKADSTITITTAELERQAVIFAGENRRQPSDEDLRALLFAYVEEQALMREAEKLGLGDDDTIIRRRLAQKMRFMIEDVGPPKTPGDAELKAWFEQNKAKFKTPPRAAFRHIYLSPETRKDSIDKDAAELLASVTDENWEGLGDPFMMSRTFAPTDYAVIERNFGRAFAASIFQLKGAMWQGPVSSAFGQHIVKLDGIERSAVPDFETAKDDIIALWTEETQRKQNTERLQALIKKYKVDIESSE